MDIDSFPASHLAAAALRGRGGGDGVLDDGDDAGVGRRLGAGGGGGGGVRVRRAATPVPSRLGKEVESLGAELTCPRSRRRPRRRAWSRRSRRWRTCCSPPPPAPAAPRAASGPGRPPLDTLCRMDEGEAVKWRPLLAMRRLRFCWELVAVTMGSVVALRSWRPDRAASFLCSDY